MPLPPERLAWAILLLAFAVFCLLCVATTLGLHFFMFQSTLSLEAELTAARGTVGVSVAGRSEQAESFQREIPDNTRIRTDRTDQWAQAMLRFFDPGQGDTVVARVVLKADTTVELGRSSRPRFTWSWPNYEIVLTDLLGELDVTIPDNLPEAVQVVIGAASSEEILISQPGRYVISVTDVQTRVTTYRGEAVLVAADGRTASAIPSGQQGVTIGETQIQRSLNPENLLNNPQLDSVSEEPIDESTDANLPIRDWPCTNGPVENLPNGRYTSATAPDGTRSLRMVRGDGADTNGFTRCVQGFGSGLDVTSYDTLELEATVMVDYQSLNGCGVFASECPMMMAIRYKTAADSDVVFEWIHGVYARPIAPRDWQRQCGTCLQANVEINQDTWYVYSSGNLFNVIPEERRPAVILQVDFFAEGHEYDVYVDSLSLLASPPRQGGVAASDIGT